MSETWPMMLLYLTQSRENKTLLAFLGEINTHLNKKLLAVQTKQVRNAWH